MHTKDLTKYFTEKAIPSSDVIIYRDHKEIYRYHCGHKDSAKTQEIKGDELYYLYSASKVITCTAAMQLVERGIIGIDDPVSKYIPDYAHLTYKDDNGVHECKNVMTIRHLFAMRGGLTYNLGTPSLKKVLEETNNQATNVQLASAFIKEPLLFEPGTSHNYSLCHDVLAAVIEVATGMSFGEYLKKNIFEPLGMKNTGFFPTEEQKKKFAAQYRYIDGEYKEIPVACVYRLSDVHESGGAGMFSCVNDYILLSDALACHGTAYNGYQVLKPETVDLMRSNQNEYAVFNAKHNNKAGYGYAFGVRTMLIPEAARSDAPTDFEFGWDGAAGSYTAIDPKHHLSIFYAQQVLGHGWVYSDVHPTLRDTMYRIAGICD